VILALRAQCAKRSERAVFDTLQKRASKARNT
jgi:hypothetical protein